MDAMLGHRLHSRVNFRPSMTRGGSECSDFVEIAECNGSYQEVYSRSGLPLAIRSDNGVPFASPTGLFNLSKLSVWWLRLGIAIERIKPGHPQQNGRHERMHLTLKME